MAWRRGRLVQGEFRIAKKTVNVELVPRLLLRSWGCEAGWARGNIKKGPQWGHYEADPLERAKVIDAGPTANGHLILHSHSYRHPRQPVLATAPLRAWQQHVTPPAIKRALPFKSRQSDRRAHYLPAPRPIAPPKQQQQQRAPLSLNTTEHFK